MRYPVPEQFRLTPISYLVIVSMAILWPFLSFSLLDSQMELTKDVTTPISEIYLPTMTIQFLILLMVLVATRSERVGMSDLGLARITRWTLFQGVGFFVGAGIVLTVLQKLIAIEAPESFAEIAGILPENALERFVWVVLCSVVAVCEEVTFRGYLITRVARFARNRLAIGVVISTLAFASGHLYQGLGGFALILIYGLLFSGLYWYTGSIWPGIIAHFLQDASVLLIPQLGT